MRFLIGKLIRKFVSFPFNGKGNRSIDQIGRLFTVRRTPPNSDCVSAGGEKKKKKECGASCTIEERCTCASLPSAAHPLGTRPRKLRIAARKNGCVLTLPASMSERHTPMLVMPAGRGAARKGVGARHQRLGFTALGVHYSNQGTRSHGKKKGKAGCTPPTPRIQCSTHSKLQAISTSTSSSRGCSVIDYPAPRRMQ